ncbi:hypothetical protein [Adhaeribacter radiodurans]|uniref:Outer membrane beta-barrel protein n=1 Tax=Adhaeribacter radiodurans TaxID=2745197 RepID=A0A7L7L7R3_9BACT|nr:hypothetical protein [Adhaeribacter radiodurans]QMU28866.1 hypothetical protein HUW48_12825 [Adhaeribacter radiodurans]
MNLRSMPEEEELDNMFRQAADSFQPDFDPEAWRDMEKKLDAADTPKSTFANWTKRSLLVLLLLMAGWLVYRYTQPEKEISKTEQITIQAEKPGLPLRNNSEKEEKQGKNIEKPEVVSSTDKKDVSNSLPNFKDKTNDIAQLPSHVNRAVTEQKVGICSRRLRVAANQAKKGGEMLSTSIQKEAGIKDTNNSLITESTVTSAVNNEIKVDTTLTAKLLNNNQNAAADSTEKIDQKTNIALDHKPLLDSAQLQTLADSALKKTRTRFLGRLGLTLALGPDFSTVGFVKPEKASTNIGVLLSYKVSNRWAILTGMVRARKVYGAKPEDYHPGPNYWPAGQHLPDDINAVCKVIDIPLNVRYSFLTLPTHVAYVQTGLSSYIMLHEDYRYDYSNYGNPYSKHWIVDNKNRHFFQVLNVSAGYNRQISPVISVGAEPFVKIPLAGIGAGKVNLTSMGIFFNVGYSFR